MKGRGFARRVTRENLEQFAPLLHKPATREGSGKTREPRAANQDDAASDALRAALALFQGERITVRRPRETAREPAAPVPEPGDGGLPGPVRDGRILIWRKRLVPSDVQSQRGNPTGGLRLTQARFPTRENPVDQTTYFRDEVFGQLAWSVGRQRPYREDAHAEFRVRIRGQELGVYRLRISHKPSGEAGQGNYTTTLHWGDLSTRVRDERLVGVELRLFGPDVPGAPFSIEIE